MQIQLTQSAEGDLMAIYNQRLRQRGPDGEDGAEALLDSLIKAMEGLAEFPLRGGVPPELEPLGIRDWRQISAWPYRIIYTARADIITVAIIADARRNFSELLERRILWLPPHI